MYHRDYIKAIFKENKNKYKQFLDSGIFFNSFAPNKTEVHQPINFLSRLVIVEIREVCSLNDNR